MTQCLSSYVSLFDLKIFSVVVQIKNDKSEEDSDLPTTTHGSDTGHPIYSRGLGPSLALRGPIQGLNVRRPLPSPVGSLHCGFTRQLVCLLFIVSDSVFRVSVLPSSVVPVFLFVAQPCPFTPPPPPSVRQT